jgi:glycosidase
MCCAPLKFSALRRVLLACCVALVLAPGMSGAVMSSATDTSAVPAQPRSSTLPEGWQHGAFMEIFVRAWRDSNGDGIGDLRGLIQSLDYLQALGIRGIWLMPITGNADGDHGYATTHFRDIAPEYGTLADFDELISQAHRRGIGVVMDYVINHAAATHPMFVQALQGPANPFHSWFVWSEEAPQGWDIWGQNPWYLTAGEHWNFKGLLKDLPKPAPDARGFYFGTFGPHMPDFNFRNPAVVDYHFSSLRFWLNRGLDGYRLDAVPHLIENSAKDWNDQPESRRITKQMQDLITAYPQRYVVCEATAEPQAYGDPALCGGAFAFGYVHHFIKAAKGDAESVEKVATFYAKALPTMATFLSSHDSFAGQRLWDQVGGDIRQYKLAAAAYLLQPGTPFVYYGEEIGQGGVTTLKGDFPMRSPMSWTADAATGGFTTGVPFRPVAPNLATQNVQAQQADAGGILSFYKAMIGLRNTLPSIARGSFEAGTAQGLVASWQRKWQREHTVVLINYGTQVALAQMAQLPPGTALHSAYPAGGAQATKSDARGLAQLWLAPQSVRVLVVGGAAPKAAGKGSGKTAGKGKGKAKVGAKAGSKSSSKSANKSASKTAVKGQRASQSKPKAASAI